MPRAHIEPFFLPLAPYGPSTNPNAGMVGQPRPPIRFDDDSLRRRLRFATDDQLDTLAGEETLRLFVDEERARRRGVPILVQPDIGAPPPIARAPMAPSPPGTGTPLQLMSQAHAAAPQRSLSDAEVGFAPDHAGATYTDEEVGFEPEPLRGGYSDAEVGFGPAPDYAGIREALRATALPTAREYLAGPRPLTAAAPSEPTAIARGLGSLATGAARTAALVPKGLAVIGPAAIDRQLEMFDRIDAGEDPWQSDDLMMREPRSLAYFEGSPERRRELRESTQKHFRDPRKTALFDAGRWVERQVTGLSEIENIPGRMVMEGIGSTTVFLAGGVLGRVLRIGPGVSAASLGAMAQAGEQFEDALRSGADLSTAFEAARLGGLVGTSEAVPILRVLDRYDKGGRIKAAILKGLEGGAEEGIQEAFQTTMSDLTAQGLYDPDRGTFAGVPEAAGVGFTVGTLFSTIAVLIGGKHARRLVRRDIQADLAAEAEQMTAEARLGPPPVQEAVAELRPPAAPSRPAEGVALPQMPPQKVTGRFVEPQVVEARPAAEEFILYHGTRGTELPEKVAFGGLHFGTRQAALDRLEQTPSLRKRGVPGAEKVLKVRVTLRNPLGSRESPINETELFLIINLPGRLGEVKKRHDGIIYRNISEDPGSVSVLVFDRGAVTTLAVEPQIVEGGPRIGAEPAAPPAPPQAPTEPSAAAPDFDSQLRATRFTGNPAVRATDGQSYRIKRQNGGFIAFQMPAEKGAPPRYFRPPEGVVWTEDQAVRRVREEIGEAAAPAPQAPTEPRAVQPAAEPIPEHPDVRRVTLSGGRVFDVRGQGATTYYRASDDVSGPFAEQWLLASPSLRKEIEQAEAAQLPAASLPAEAPQTIYRGYGRAERAEVYNTTLGAGGLPILGEGRYYTFARKEAEAFGSTIEERPLQFGNPLVIRSDQEWRDFAKRAGYPFAVPTGVSEAEMRQAHEGLRRILAEGGHDAIIFWWDNTTKSDVDRYGNQVKTLRDAFDAPQVFVPAIIRPTEPRVGAEQPQPAAEPEPPLPPTTPTEPEAQPPAAGRPWEPAELIIGPQRRQVVGKAYKDEIEIGPPKDSGFDVALPKVYVDIKRHEVIVERYTDTIKGEKEREVVFKGEDMEGLIKVARRVAAARWNEARGFPRTQPEVGPEIVVTGEEAPATAPPAPGVPKTRPLTLAKSAEGLVGALERLDRVRNAPEYSAEIRRDAGRVYHQALVRLEELEQVARTTPFNERPERYQITIESARGQRTTYEIPSDPEAIAEFRKRVEKAGPRIFQAQAPAPARPERGPGPRHVRTDTAERGAVVPREEQPAGPPITREAVVREFTAALGIPVYERHIKSRRMLGFFRPGVAELRLRRGATDLEVLAHEMAHYLDLTLDRSIRKMLWTPARKANAKYREELRAVTYERRKGLLEGFAEFMRLWLTQKDKAQAVAPNLYGWAEDYFAGVEHGPAFRRAQEQMHAWFAQDAATRAKSKIAPDELAEATLNTMFQRGRQSITDDLQGILSMENRLLGKIEPVGAYETARLTRAKYSIIDGALRFGAPRVRPDGSHEFVGKGLVEILDPVSVDLNNWITYMVGRRAQLLKRQGREKLFTKAEIQGMLALKTEVFWTAALNWERFNKAILDFAQVKGVIDPEARARWETDVYIPFYRVGQKGPGAKGRGGTPGDFGGIKALTGGTGALRDVLTNMIQNTAMLIDAALTNEAIVKVARLSQMEGGARFMAKIPKASVKVKIPTDEVKRVFFVDVLGIDPKAAETSLELGPIATAFDAHAGLMEFWLHGQKPRGDDIVVGLTGGKPTYYQVADPVLMRSLQALRRPARGQFMRALTGVRRIVQGSITLSFDFLVRNIARDTIMGSIMSKHGFKPFVDSARGLKSRFTQDANYREFIANGGGFASYLMDEDAFKANLSRFYNKRGIDPATVLDTPRKLLLGLERIADAFEMSTRLGEFRKARKADAPVRHAAYEAREVSTDFAMRGDSEVLGFFFDTVPFFKAAMNGIDRYYRGLASDVNRGDVARRTANLALLSMLLYLLNRGNPEYDDMEDWDRDNYWHFFIPRRYLDGAESDLHLRYPKIWEVGGIASIAERTMQAGLDGPDAEIFKAMGHILLRMFNLETYPLPAVVEPVAEQVANRRFFFDRPIETETMRKLPPYARAGPYTSRTMRALGEAQEGLPRSLQLSPARAEALLRGYLNTWAMYGLMLSDAMFFDDAPEMRLDQYPVVRTFYQQEPARTTKYVRQFYDLARELSEARAVARDAASRLRPELAKEMAARKEAQLARGMGKAADTMSGILKVMAVTASAPDLKVLWDVVVAPWQTQRAAVYRQLGIPAPSLPTAAARNDIGKLKAMLLDDMIRVKNAFAKRVVQQVEAERAKP